MSNKKWSGGILGTAWVAHERLIPAINGANITEILAIASKNMEKAKNLARAHIIHVHMEAMRSF
jgi:predicted dehydrogenase